MASTPVEIQAPSGRTLTLELYPLGSDTIANTGGDSLTEHTNRKGFYQATVTESLSGWHHVLVKDGSTPILVGYIYLTDTTSVHRTEAPPWSVLEGRVTVEVDLVDAPNADAITAIQNGLATASALSTTDGKIDGIKAVTDALPDAGALTSLATATALQTVDDNVDAIKAVTDQLPDSGALTSLAAKTDLPANFSDLAITETTGRVTVGTNSDKTGYSLHSDYDAAKTAAQAGDEMALTSGTLSDIGTAAEAAAAAALADYDPPTKTQLDAAVAPLATSVELAAVDAKIDTVDGIADAILAAVGTDGVAISSATMQAIADALLDRANAIDSKTLRQALRLIAAVILGKSTGSGTTTETFMGLDGSTERVRVTLDEDYNRVDVEHDPT